MCGIAGILTTADPSPIPAALAAMKEALRHRGPDDEGVELADLAGGFRLGLAHTRLAILDVTRAGHQPMADPDTGSWIVYNGEVYNHQALRQQMPGCTFRGGSDTETILKAWVQRSVAVLDKLRGMFAFALYDGRRRQLWLVRDRLGVKPLYVCQANPQTWVFASEVRALLASGLVGRRLHAPAVQSYLAFGAVPDPWTLIEGVRSLLPGEAWHFDLGTGNNPLTPERIRYWRPGFSPGQGPAPTQQEAVEQLRPILKEAVSLRMLSDVPVGVFLSGGIDSGAVVAVLASQGYRLRTFSVVFGEQSFDESVHSRHIARRFGTEHTELLLRPGKILEQFEQALGAYDQPSIDGFNTYFIAQATRQAGVKVALSGLGGDELFAGYHYFRYLAQFEGVARRGLAWILHEVLRRFRPNSMRTQKLGALLSGTGSRLANYAVCRQVMLPDRRALLARFGKPDLLGLAEDDSFALPAEVVDELGAATAGLDPVNAHSRLELSLYLGNMLLRDTDQMSMAHSLEVREPLLDHVLVDAVARLPGAMKMALGRQGRIKGLLLDALPAPLPEETLRRPKMGFVFPWEHWLRQELREQVAANLTDRDTLEAAGLDGDAVRSLWESFLARRPGLRYTDILCLNNLLAWVKRHQLAFQPILK